MSCGQLKSLICHTTTLNISETQFPNRFFFYSEVAHGNNYEERIAERTQAKRVLVKRITQAFLDEVTSELCKNNRLEFRDFGVFETRTRAARIAQNPKTLERVEVPPKRTVKFKMGRLMRENLSASMPESAEAK
jgi:nucleoid DNA-binding protein